MEENTHFKHTFPVQLRFSDVDRFGHVNNSVYFSLYDLAKTTYFNDVMGNGTDWDSLGVVAANIQANFLSPIFFDENIAIETTTTHLGNKSFTLFQRAINTDTQEVKCLCQTIMVAFNLTEKISMPIPEEFKHAICAFEQKEELTKQVSE